MLPKGVSASPEEGLLHGAVSGFFYGHIVRTAGAFAFAKKFDP